MKFQVSLTKTGLQSMYKKTNRQMNRSMKTEELKLLKMRLLFKYFKFKQSKTLHRLSNLPVNALGYQKQSIIHSLNLHKEQTVLTIV